MSGLAEGWEPAEKLTDTPEHDLNALRSFVSSGARMARVGFKTWNMARNAYYRFERNIDALGLSGVVAVKRDHSSVILERIDFNE